MSHKRLLTSREKILLHLPLELGDMDNRNPYTQRGISAATGITLNHVPRELAALMRDGLVEERREHVPERGRRLKVYFLTQMGRGMAGRVEKKIETMRCDAGGVERSLLSLVREHGVSVVEDIEQGRFCETGKPTVSMDRIFPGAPEIELLGRGQEVREVLEFLSKKDSLMAIYGGSGMGKKALLAHCLGRMSFRRAVWLDASSGKKMIFEEQLTAFVANLGMRWDGSMDMIPVSTVLAVVDYNEPEDGLLELLERLAEGVLSRKGVKMVVTSREDIHMYHRFYSSLQHRELTLKGLSMEESGMFMGIGGEELRTIHQLLKGKPLAMRYLLEENKQGLLDVMPLNPEEVRLLFYLKRKGMGELKEEGEGA